MKFGNSKVMATIMALAMATTLAGCSKDENNSVQGDSDTEKDLLTSSSSIDIWSAQESIDSSLNSHDTSKPIEKTEPDSSANSSVSDDKGTSSDANGSLTDDGTSDSDKGTSSDDSADSSSTGETSSQPSGETSSQPSGETSKPSDNTTSVPSNSSLTDDKDSSANSSANDATSNSSNSNTSNGVALDKIVIADANKRVYYDKDGNPMPDDFDPSNGGFYDKSGNYTMTEEEYAEYVAMSNRGDEAIKNGTYGTPDEETAAELWALIGG